MGKCVVVVTAENGSIAAAFNEDGFTSDGSGSPNLNGFIVSVTEEGGCGEIFHRNDHGVGILNDHYWGPVFGNNLVITDSCHQNEYSSSILGGAYGKGPGLNQNALFRQKSFRVVDYEVFKIVTE
jgi:hypothetical protein